MGRILSLVLLISGIGYLVYGGWQLISTNTHQKEALKIAQDVINQNNENA